MVCVDLDGKRRMDKDPLLAQAIMHSTVRQTPTGEAWRSALHFPWTQGSVHFAVFFARRHLRRFDALRITGEIFQSDQGRVGALQQSDFGYGVVGLQFQPSLSPAEV